MTVASEPDFSPTSKLEIECEIYFWDFIVVRWHQARNPAEPIASKVPPPNRIVIEAIRCAYDAAKAARRKPPNVKELPAAVQPFLQQREGRNRSCTRFRAFSWIRNLEILQLQHFRRTSVPSAAISHER
jgi:hypothetical protein